MKYVVIVTHGAFAKGLKTSLDMLAGIRNDVIAIGLEDGKTADEFAVLFKDTIANIKQDDEVILLADIIGGSPLTTSLNVLSENKMMDNTTVIGGVNLPLALTSVLMKDNLDGEVFVETVLNEAKNAIQEFKIEKDEEEEI